MAREIKEDSETEEREISDEGGEEARNNKKTRGEESNNSEEAVSKERRGNLTEENFESFKEEYEKAVDSDEESFMFEGQYILTRYARYVIEYMNIRKKT